MWSALDLDGAGMRALTPVHSARCLPPGRTTDQRKMPKWCRAAVLILRWLIVGNGRLGWQLQKSCWRAEPLIVGGGDAGRPECAPSAVLKRWARNFMIIVSAWQSRFGPVKRWKFPPTLMIGSGFITRREISLGLAIQKPFSLRGAKSTDRHSPALYRPPEGARPTGLPLRWRNIVRQP